MLEATCMNVETALERLPDAPSAVIEAALRLEGSVRGIKYLFVATVRYLWLDEDVFSVPFEFCCA